MAATAANFAPHCAVPWLRKGHAGARDAKKRSRATNPVPLPGAAPGDVIELDITNLVAGGDGLGRDADGRVVFVPGVVPGERAIVTITEARRDFARASLEELLIASPSRAMPPCPFVAHGCGGCDWQHIAAGAQGGFKRDLVIDALRRIGRIDDPQVRECIAMPDTGYRTTVRVAVDADGRPCFRKAASHDLVAVDDCLVAHPLLSAMLAEGRWPGAREVVLRCGARTGEILVDVRPHQEGTAAATFFHEIVGGRTFRISAGSFFQIRPEGAEALAELVRAALTEHAARDVVDLYSGVGLFAGLLHDAGFTVRAAIEGGRFAAEDLRVNVDGLCDVVEADITRWPGLRVDAVVADPARTGLGPEGVATIERCAPRVVVLVSCDVAALGRDTRLLRTAGYSLMAVTPVDLFPHTAHVEAVAAFVRL